MPGMMQTGVAIATGVAARKAANTTWKLGSGGKEPPTDPANPEATAREAIAWAIFSGALMGVARVLIARKMAERERSKEAVRQAVGATDKEY